MQPFDAGLIGVSFVVPVLDGERHLGACLAAILAEAARHPCEVLAIDDGSRDGSRAIAEQIAASDDRVRVVVGPGRGAAAAIQHGLRLAAYDVVCQVDQDVVLDPGWLERLLDALSPAGVAAAQACYRAAADASAWARVCGLDLSLRYAALGSPEVDHVCTGNTAYRKRALLEVGGLDETFGYAYDNDLSYRLCAAGHRLVVVTGATAVHHWRSDLAGYLRQQYGQGLGRLALIAKHRGRLSGDRISGLRMILHVPTLALALALALVATLLFATGGAWRAPTLIAAALLGVLALDRVVAAAQSLVRSRDPAVLLLPLAHLLRDGAWLWAAVRFAAYRLAGRRPGPQDSMPR